MFDLLLCLLLDWRLLLAYLVHEFIIDHLRLTKK